MDGGLRGGVLLFSFQISSSWVDLRLYAEFQLSNKPIGGRFMVGDKLRR